MDKDKFDIEIPNVESKEKGSSFGAYFNIVCAVAGTGTLGLPYAIKIGGWLSMLIFLLVGVLAIYTSKLLIECLYYKPGHRLDHFADIGEVSFGKFGKYFILLFNSLILLLCSSIYILLTGINVRTLVTQFYGEQVLSDQLYILICGIGIIIPCIFCKTLKEVALLALFGTLATVVLVICVIILGGIQYSHPDFTPSEHTLFDLSGFPIALVTITFSYGGNVVYPQVEATMRNPKAWNKVMVLSVLTITLLYSLISGISYFYYGNLVTSPILDSLPPVAGTQVCYIMITIHVILATPIYMCTFCYEQEMALKIDTKHMSKKKELVYRTILRSFVGTILILIAMYIPFFEDLTALVGSITDCVIIYLVPLACHYKLFGWRGRKWYEYILSVLTVIVGLTGLILGTKDAVLNLIDDFQGIKNK
ncbi:hypothetical protein K502DRAFT_295122 [Neoconidiobolus thromboides FSU 785]|nr:hypothetical protein K502DRAFT_295122 [Neoconidiobolus thromboides FSU 785]